MVIVRLEGGLGNQMFQYSIGKHLALINHTNLKLDINDISANSGGFRLNVFKTNTSVAEKKEIEAIKNKKLPFFLTLKYKLLRKEHIPYFRKQEIYEAKLFHFDKNVLCAPKDVYLTGYWQSYRYFEKIRKVILKDFEFAHPPSELNYPFIKNIIAENSVSIHVRRGDYVSNPETLKIHGVCSLEYYQHAIKYICDKTDEPFFYVFSDDIAWAKKNISLTTNSLFIEGTPDKKDHFEMYLMSLCKHNIIANSSFSWWGAWLNTNPDKIVIAPKQWMADISINTTDLIPENWIRL